MHIAMCAPMIVIAGILLVSGSGVGILVSLAACMLMMAMMMGAMDDGESRDGDRHQGH